jgi:AraC-like DNA-binding protein
VSRILYSENVELIKVEDTIVNRAREYMKTHLDQPLKIGDLATEVNLSISRFTELYKEKTGYSPIQNLILLRIQKSCQLLYFTDHSVKEIAVDVGFSDPFYFSRMFKKLMGVAPTVYKKQHTRGVSSD